MLSLSLPVFVLRYAKQSQQFFVSSYISSIPTKEWRQCSYLTRFKKANQPLSPDFKRSCRLFTGTRAHLNTKRERETRKACTLRVFLSVCVRVCTFFLSLMEPFPRTIILQPVSASSCLAVSPRGPRILPTKLNCTKEEKHTRITKPSPRERRTDFPLTHFNLSLFTQCVHLPFDVCASVMCLCYSEGQK